MTMLNIYNSNDTNCTDQLCSLNNGYHFVGRETPIKSNNKLVSRKHARIIVHKNGAIIESVHVNPTFFKSSVGGPIQLLKEHESLSLNNGDCFALVEDADWFKVKITCENTEETQTDTFSNNSLSNKRSINEDISETNKRIKIETDNSLDTTTHSSRVAVTSTVSSCILPNANATEHPDLDSTVEELDLTVEALDVASAKSTVNDEKLLDVTAANLPVNGTHVLTFNNIETEQPELDSTLEGVALAFTINNTSHVQNTIKIKTEKPDDDDSSLYLPMPLPLPEIKKEPVTDGINNPTSTNNENNLPVKIEPPNPTESDQPSSSTNDNIPAWRRDHPDWRRDRCWYGKDCYRKNPVHKQDVSHPGDSDYDSDPNDKRIVCPFGRNCYRINIQHRRQFKHFGKPAPKPDFVHVNGCSCCHNSRNKPGYESDCEDTDPE